MSAYEEAVSCINVDLPPVPLKKGDGREMLGFDITGNFKKFSPLFKGS